MRIVRLLVLLGFFTTTALADDELVGRWVDKLVGTKHTGVIELRKTSEGFIQHRAYSDGSTWSRRMEERRSDVRRQREFIVIDNERGEGCSILPDGSLELFDAEGPIRRAEPKKG